MGYVGNQQTEGFSQVPAKQDLTGATGTSLTLTHAVASAEGIDLFINNVRQEPTTAYSVGGDGVTVTLTGSVVATDDIYVVYNSLARQTSTHPSNQALQATSGTFSGAMSAASATVTGDLTVDTNTLYVDSTNNRVGIGTSSPSGKLDVSTDNPVLRLTDTDTALSDGEQSSAIEFYQSDSAGAGVGASIGAYGQGSTGLLNLRFATGSNSEAMRIDSVGRIYSGTTSAIDGSRLNVYSSNNGTGIGVSTSGTSYSHLYCKDLDGGTGTHYILWIDNVVGSNVGKITHNGSSTSYQTTSDYRLKENVVADWDATTRLKQLNPVRFNFIANPDTTVDGFLAHEVQDIVPEAISGTHNEVDDGGNPVYQGIDQSKLVPLLVKTIQELEARITALEAN